MRAAITLEAASLGSWEHQKLLVREAEKMGLDVCWVAEAWGSDAVSALGFYAACTDRMLLGSGVIQLSTRTPVAIAQAAITLSNISGGRFLLGLGASGPQVIEGLHGQPFERPLGRMRETIDIVRQAIAGDRIAHRSRNFQIPRADSETKPMRLSMRSEHRIPLYLASLTPAMLRLTGELADGWLGTSFVPEGADAAYFTHLDDGLALSGRTRADLDICQGAEVSFASDERHLKGLIDSRKIELAFSLGGMGSARTNFYNQAYSRQGWSVVAAAVKERWQAGDREGAAALITDEMVLATTLIGTASMVRDRLQVWCETGVDTVRIYPAGESLEDRIATLGAAIDPVHSIERSAR
ncbi:LLM class flavin-dependent oxidoreductase [Mycolicibacter minnesotensis]